MKTADELAAIADELAQIRDTFDELAARAACLLTGLGPIRDRARAWLAALDRATGSEPATTIDDTVEEIRAAATIASARPCPPLEATR
jgi:hypothetical protein